MNFHFHLKKNRRQWLNAKHLQWKSSSHWHTVQNLHSIKSFEFWTEAVKQERQHFFLLQACSSPNWLLPTWTQTVFALGPGWPSNTPKLCQSAASGAWQLILQSKPSIALLCSFWKVTCCQATGKKSVSHWTLPPDLAGQTAAKGL